MWYKNWFDSEFYHLLYKNRDEQEAEQFIDAITEFLKLKPGMKILDLPCGKGRHAVYFAKKGYKVYAADLSCNSIQHAKSMEHDHLHFSVHDMLDEFPEKNFDAIFNLFTSFGYFENESDDIKILSNFKSSLKPNGFLIIDFLNPDDVLKNLVEISEFNEGDIKFTISKTVKNGFVEKKVTFSCEKEEHEFHEKVKLLSLDDFSRLLNATGLQIFHTFGSYSLQAYNKESSERLIIVAGK